jgi:hypothetical protein
MSGNSEEWAALASQHERVMASAEAAVPAGAEPVNSRPARWAELASQRERLVAPLSGLASSSQSGTALRLAVRAPSAA